MNENIVYKLKSIFTGSPMLREECRCTPITEVRIDFFLDYAHQDYIEFGTKVF